MALHLTGSEILTIESSLLSVTVKGKGNKERNPFVSKQKDSTVTIDGKGSLLSVSILGHKDNVNDDISNGYWNWNGNVEPLFFEQTDYVFLIRSKDNSLPLSIHATERSFEEIIIPQFEDDLTQLAGVINFGNNVGYSDFHVLAGESTLLSLRIEVFPSKISYKEDYRAMMQDLDRIISDSVLDFMKKTWHGVSTSHKKDDTPAVYFAVLEGVYQPFLSALKRIIAAPHHKLITEHDVQPHNKVKQTDCHSLRWLQKHPESVYGNCGRVSAERILCVRKTITFDTSENRLVKFMVQRILRRTKEFTERLKNVYPQNKIKSITDKTEHISRDLNRILTTTILRNVADYSASESMSLVFEMAPGYRELYKFYLMLLNGISVTGDIFKVSVRETALLYEYWCFLKLYDILKAKYTLKSPDVIKVDRRGVTVDIVKGKASVVRFFNDVTREHIELSYNPKEISTQTVAQRPDNILSLEKRGAKNQYKYVFDAKYRIEMNPDPNTYPDKEAGPKLDDINTMHRYRDSIVYENANSRFTFEKTMFGAYILFPYPYEEEKYRNHRFYKSIDKVNIGGIPFLPSATKLITELLDELVQERADAAYERASMPIGIDTLLREHRWKKKEILIGTISNQSELTEILEDKLFTIENYDGNEKQYILLWCLDKTDYGCLKYYGRVMASFSANAVSISGVNPGKAQRSFLVDEWKLFKEPIGAFRNEIEKLQAKTYCGYANPERQLRLRLQRYLSDFITEKNKNEV